MADGNFAVDETALRAAAHGIRGTVAQVAVSAAAPVGALVGHDGLGRTLDGFLERWRDGVRALAEDGRAMAEQLEGDARAYSTVDDRGRAGFDAVLRGEGLDPAAG